ncbi:unnamed protein product, partial [Tenebrio molitor]
ISKTNIFLPRYGSFVSLGNTNNTPAKYLSFSWNKGEMRHDKRTQKNDSG